MLRDEQLWKKLKTGERQALEMLFRRYHKDLYRYAVKYCNDREMAEDQIQNLFLKIWLRKGHLGDVTAVKTYLWTSLRRELISNMKQKEKRQKKVRDHISASYFSLSIEEFIIKGEEEELQKRRLAKAIKALSSKQREILYLRFYEGMSYQEIEEIMSVNYQVARNYLYQTLQNLRESAYTKIPVHFFFLFCFLSFLAITLL